MCGLSQPQTGCLSMQVVSRRDNATKLGKIIYSDIFIFFVLKNFEIIKQDDFFQVSSRGLQFSPEMIRDQELLVTSMSQQGIPETLIRRQFDRLIDEQSKQLRLLGDNSKSAEANAPRIKRNNSEETRRDNHHQTPTPKTKLEPSSLLKIRLRKEEMDFQKRNNGLQDPVVAQSILKKCTFKGKTIGKNEDESTRAQGQIVRLNGAQDRSEMESLDLHKRTVDVREKQKSANGLENARNSQRVEQHTRQQDCEENAVLLSSQNEQAASVNVANEQQHMTQSSFNNLTYWPELQEPRVIGGLTYFARKPQCIPNVPALLCNNYSCVDQNKAART